MSQPPGSEVKGFLPDNEGAHLFRLACEAALLGPLLEIGSYCGRSTLWLAQAAAANHSVVFAVDHHRGSEEHQAGEYFHDPDLVDANGQFDSFPAFRQNLRRAQMEPWVIPIVASSQQLARYWRPPPLGLVFIDGGHSLTTALADYRAWAPSIAPGGLLVIHDVFPDPAEGGQAPFTVWQLARDSGLFEPHSECATLRALRRLG